MTMIIPFFQVPRIGHEYRNQMIDDGVDLNGARPTGRDTYFLNVVLYFSTDDIGSPFVVWARQTKADPAASRGFS